MLVKIDYIPKGYTIFNLRAAGKKYVVRKKSCLLCKYCVDIVWDYTNGPYMVSCEKRKDTEKGFSGKCRYYRKGVDYV